MDLSSVTGRNLPDSDLSRAAVRVVQMLGRCVRSPEQAARRLAILADQAFQTWEFLDEASRKKRKPQALDDVQTGYYAGGLWQWQKLFPKPQALDDVQTGYYAGGYEDSYDAAKVPAGTRSYRAGRQKSSRSADNGGRRLQKMQDPSYDLETYASEEPEHDAPQEPEHI
ncbi:unnamed protein product [Amoebophrya sp. A120]|nr:unnamed protein product [Amoebophrya sp. A120]|eukprot:GSA120T00024282001.1